MNSKISTLKGIGDKTAQLFQKIGIETIDDLIHYYPRSFEIYEDPIPIANVEEGKICTISGAVFGRIQVGGNPKMQITSLYLKDMTGTIKVTWFRMPYVRSMLSHGGSIILRGRIVRKRDGIVMEHPTIYYPPKKYDEKRYSMQPVYALTAGLSNNMITKAVKQALNFIPSNYDTLPKCIRERYGMNDYINSLQHMHFPETKDQFIKARERFVFEEFLVFILSLRRMKANENRATNQYSISNSYIVDSFLTRLPFSLTNAQLKVWHEIQNDMMSDHVMSRLVQGDVGSGKTIVAFLALLTVAVNGYQGALMAPTEVLAKQHFDTFTNMIQSYDLPIKVELLTGSMTAAKKREAYGRIESGDVSIIIGTHALIQKKVQYQKLALVVTDEQHRFGVRQRETFAEKGLSPHILVMSATPIPRTLAIILYGDLDISIIDEMPKNRLPIKNCVVDTSYREKAYHFINNQVCEGRQCYVICPMVEESESLEVENVTDYAAMLSEELGDSIHVAYLHGKMKQAEKDQIMDEFSHNKIQVLVSTTVIEVGIDVPNATVMLIENAERFGLAQLHQLRGRVGRGAYQSYCIFMSSSKTNETKERLNILGESNDGFFIAGEDLRLRGPGDLFGIRQSGILDFKLADVFQDAQILKSASKVANELLTKDPELKNEECKHLKDYIDSKISRLTLESTL